MTDGAIRHPLDPRNPLLGLYLAMMLFELAEGALRFLVPLNLNDRGMDPQVIGFVMAAFSATSLLSRGAAAAVFRPERARRLVVAAGLASTVAYVLMPFVPDAGPLTVLMAIDGFCWGLTTTCLLAMLMLCTPSTMSPTVAMGWYVGFQGIAFTLAAVVGGLLGEALGIRPAMLALAAAPALAAGLIALGLPPVVRPPAPSVPPTPAGAGLGWREWVRASVRRRVATAAMLPLAVWTAAMVAVYLNVMNGLLQSFYPLLGLALGLSVAQIGTLSGIRSGASTVARFGAGWLFARIPARRLHLPLLATSALTLALLPAAGQYLVHLPLFAANGVSRGLLRVTTGATAMETTAPHQAGTAAAVMTAGLDAGKLVGPLIGGVVAAAIGLEAMFVTVPLGFLAVSVGLYLASRRRSTAARAGADDVADAPTVDLTS